MKAMIIYQSVTSGMNKVRTQNYNTCQVIVIRDSKLRWGKWRRFKHGEDRNRFYPFRTKVLLLVKY